MRCSGPACRFLLAAETDLEPYIARVKDAALAHALSFGVGYIHETMPHIERQVVEFLFESGAIQVGACVVFCAWAEGPEVGWWLIVVAPRLLLKRAANVTACLGQHGTAWLLQRACWVSERGLWHCVLPA